MPPAPPATDCRTRSRFVGLQHGLQLPIRAFFVIALQTLQTFSARFAACEQAASDLVAGIMRQHGAKTLGGRIEVSALPQHVPDIELIRGIARVAFERLAEVFERRGKTGPRFRSA